jgi:hypothetical protein
MTVPGVNVIVAATFMAAVGVVAILLGASRALAVAPPPLPVPPLPSPNVAAANEAIDRAGRIVRAHDSACRYRLADVAPRMTSGSPPPGLLASFSVLTRGTSAITELFREPLPGVVPKPVYQDYVRVRVLPNGIEVFVVPGLEDRFAPLPRRCDGEQLAVLRRLLRSRPSALRFALHRDRKLLHHRRGIARRSHALLCLLERDRFGILSGGCGWWGDVRNRGVRADGSRLDALLVPDGVATVDRFFIRRRLRAGQHRFLRVRGRASDNTVVFRDPTFGDPDLMPYGEVWRAADGQVRKRGCAVGCIEWARHIPLG